MTTSVIVSAKKYTLISPVSKELSIKVEDRSFPVCSHKSGWRHSGRTNYVCRILIMEVLVNLHVFLCRFQLSDTHIEGSLIEVVLSKPVDKNDPSRLLKGMKHLTINTPVSDKTIKLRSRR